VDLRLELQLGEGYHSKSQIARVVTQGWIGRELGCLACDSPGLLPTAQNTKARDFVCERCEEPYELKSTGAQFGHWINDGQYETLLNTIKSGRTPNLLLLEYSWRAGLVRNLTAVHRSLLSPLAVVPRNPLAVGARRAGWKGCKIDLSQVPESGRVSVVSDSIQIPFEAVRRKWSRLGFMVNLEPVQQGWMRDVLACLERLPMDSFALRDVYEFDGELRELHPENRHVRPKIRQQLQELVARGILARTQRGRYSRAS